MKKLAVGSMFANDDRIQQKWLNLQLKYLTATTKSFDHFAVVGDNKNGAFEKKTNVLPAPPIVVQKFNNTGKRVWKESNAHIRGLNVILEFFKTKSTEYDWFLFMDSDAFPIHINWLDKLSSAMTDKQDVATIIRFENRLVNKRAINTVPHLPVPVTKYCNDINFLFNYSNSGHAYYYIHDQRSEKT